MTEHVKSYYAATANDHQPYPQLNESIDCDVCIVGAAIPACHRRCFWLKPVIT